MKSLALLCITLTIAMLISACANAEPQDAKTTEITTTEPEITIKTEAPKTSAETTVEAPTETVGETTVETAQETTAEATTEVKTEITTEITTEVTTEATLETTVKITAEATEKEAPAETTVQKKDTVKITAHAPTVLDGEYTYGGEPVIENVDGFTYVNGILIANKTYSLPKGYDPRGLHPDASGAFSEMQAAAKADGISIKIISGYRSYSHQKSTYENYCKRDGQAAADRYSARPGNSEHQTGLAMDINSLKTSFGKTETGVWLAEHCAEYGFIIRYPEGKEEKTGFMYEPWHIRYVGKELAAKITASGLCLEEFLGITSVYGQ